MVIILSLWTLQQIDVLGAGSALGRNSHAIASRILAPWYPTATSEAAAVVLFPRPWQTAASGNLAATDKWPPERSEILAVLQRILHQCPKAIVVDLFFDSDRDTDNLRFSEMLGHLLATRAEVGCAPQPALIFADDVVDDRPMPEALVALAEGAWERKHTLAAQEITAQRSAHQVAVFEAYFSGDEAPPEPEFDRFQGPSLPRDDAQRLLAPACGDALALAGKERATVGIETRVALAVASWPAADERGTTTGGFEGRRTDDFYFALGFNNPAPSSPLGIAADTTAAERTRDDGRASMALAAFFAYCERGANCAARGGDNAYAAAAAFWAPGASRCPLAVEHRDSFSAPVDLVWPRWAPPANLSFVAYGDGVTHPSVDDCHPKRVASLTERLQTSVVAAIGQVPSALDSFQGLSRGRCYPLATLNAEQIHIAPERVTAADGTVSMPLAPGPSATLSADVNRALAHKVVFVGLDDLAAGPTVESPVHGRLPGVFDHAIAFDNLVHWRDRYMRPPANALIIFGVPISKDAIFELVASITLAAALVAAGRASFPVQLMQGLWYRLFWWRRHAPPHAASALSLYFLATLVDFSSTMLRIALAFVASLAFTLVLYFAMSWSIMNWIGISFSAIIPALVLWQTSGLPPRFIIADRRSR